MTSFIIKKTQFYLVSKHMIQLNSLISFRNQFVKKPSLLTANKTNDNNNGTQENETEISRTLSQMTLQENESLPSSPTNGKYPGSTRRVFTHENTNSSS